MFWQKNRIRTFGPVLLILSVWLGLAAGPPGEQEAFKAGQDGQGPWWMRQTALSREGKFADLKSKPWWKKTAGLKVGESFIVDEKGEAQDRMLVRRERFTIRSGKEVEAVVWVIDDDGDGSLRNGGDKDSDCYIADYDGDGIVDRMVDYLDDDGDGIPDEMDIRYFDNGRLNYSWFGIDLDDDGIMWSLRGYEYGGESYFESDPYGDNIFYMNKFNPVKGTWSPISECPFAFYDTDHDGASEIVVRVSAVPMSYDAGADPDYANSAYARPWEKAMADMGVINIRYSFDIDQGSGRDHPLHYDFGFNMVGHTPYQFPGMVHFNARRRPPQETVCIPWKDMRAVADSYQARQTGFSWHENFDDTTAIGFAKDKDNDYRWEGVFWVWERRFMENTGGPCQKWNVRREWLSQPKSKRELYYSGVDKRIHLFGAEEGWIQVGNFSGLGPIGEIRMFDTDGNGYFDRWEVYLGAGDIPVRVTTVRDEKARRIEFNPDQISNFYLMHVLPEAKADYEKFASAISAVHPFDIPAGLKEAMASRTGSEGFRRYARDVARELQYQNLREHFARQANALLFKDSEDKSGKEFLGDLRWITKNKITELETTPNSQTAWKLARLLEDLDVAYGQGDFGAACAWLEKIRSLGVFR